MYLVSMQALYDNSTIANILYPVLNMVDTVCVDFWYSKSLADINIDYDILKLE